jgi:uncharacterized protein
MAVRVEINGLTFDWDDQKVASNMAKHGVTFEMPRTYSLIRFFRMLDAATNDEARDAVIGYDSKNRLLFVVHIQQEAGALRIISARRVVNHERQLYEQ